MVRFFIDSVIGEQHRRRWTQWVETADAVATEQGTDHDLATTQLTLASIGIRASLRILEVEVKESPQRSTTQRSRA
jgi:hypothetical protein